MLDRKLVELLHKDTLLEYQESYQKELELTNRRLERLKKKQEINPVFESYDRWADAMVGIDIRIEEQEVVKDELEGCLELFNGQLNVLALKEQYPGATILAPSIAQLNLFDGSEK